MLSELNTNNETLHENKKWVVGDGLNAYWPLFEGIFPYLHDTLTVNFQSRPITGTAAEQTFSMTATQVRPNNCASTNSKNMNHAQSVRGAILREMYNFTDSHNSKKRKRQMRSIDSRHEYLLNLSEYADSLDEPEQEIKTVKEMRGKGKKMTELVEIYEHTKNEVQANERHENKKSSGDAVLKSIQSSSHAKENHLDLCEIVVDEWVEKTRKMTSKGLKDMLLSYYSDQPTECKIIKKANKGDNDITGSLVQRVVEYWKKNNTLPNEL